VTKAHGLRGELQVDIDASIRDQICADSRVRLADAARSQEFRIAAVRTTRGGLLLKLDGIDDRSAAEKWARAEVLVDRDALLRGADAYFDFELVGLQAITGNGEILGTVSEVLATGANDVLVVVGEKGEILVPAVASAVLEIDIAAGRVLIDERAVVRQDDEVHGS
jgi:16S rRNA processing protein RimM